MEEEKKIKWGTFALVVAVLVLAAGVFFAGFKISTTVNAGIEGLLIKSSQGKLKSLFDSLPCRNIILIHRLFFCGVENG